VGPNIILDGPHSGNLRIVLYIHSKVPRNANDKMVAWHMHRERLHAANTYIMAFVIGVRVRALIDLASLRSVAAAIIACLVGLGLRISMLKG
jgi:hypothetical protein